MASEPMTTEELEDATRYVECGETKFGEGWAEERNIPLLRRLLDENARLNAELESLRVHNGVLVTEVRFQGDRAERMRVERDRAINECDDWETKYAELSVERDALRRALPAAPEMPRPPAEEAPTEYMVVVPSIIGSLEDWRTDYRTDGVRKSTRDEAIAHGLEAEGHDDWLIAIVVGDKLTGLAWQHEDRDDAEEIAEAAEALGLAVPEAANGTAQSPSSGPETPGMGSGRGTDIAEASGTAQEGDDA